jgi:hypothetical protein
MRQPATATGEDGPIARRSERPLVGKAVMKSAAVFAPLLALAEVDDVRVRVEVVVNEVARHARGSKVEGGQLLDRNCVRLLVKDELEDRGLVRRANRGTKMSA